MQLEQLDLPGGGLLTVYLRDCVETMPQAMERPLVLVVPGGGYTHLSAREGDPVALQFAAAGYHTAVLRYAVGDDAAHGLPLRQLAAAIGLVRQNAAQWHVLPDKIAVCGFSAGGHLALSGAVLAVPGLPDPPQRGDFGLPGHHGRGVRPPGQFCAAGRSRSRGTAGVLAGGQDHAPHPAGVRLAHHGGRDGPGGEHPAAGQRPAPGRGAVRGASV